MEDPQSLKVKQIKKEAREFLENITLSLKFASISNENELVEYKKAVQELREKREKERLAEEAWRESVRNEI